MNPFRFKILIPITAVLIFVGLSVGCASREEKRDSFLKKGIELYDKGQYKKAILEFKNALQLDPKFVTGHLYIGKAHLQENDIKRAIGSLLTALELDENLDQVRLDLATLFLKQKNSEKALEQVQPLLAKIPTHPGALLASAQAYILMKNHREAINNLERIPNEERGKEVLSAFASAYKYLGETELFVQYLKQYQEVAPEDPAAYIFLSQFYGGKKDFDSAENQLRILSERKKEPTFAILLCRFFMETGQEHKAETELKRLISQYPDEKTYILGYAEYLYRMKRFDEAQTILEEAARNASDSWEIWSYKVEVFIAQGKAEEAIGEIDRFLDGKTQTGKVDAIVKKGEILLELKRLEEARKQSKLALSNESANFRAKLLLGNILTQKGSYDEAVVQLREAVNTNPSDPQGYISLSKALEASGNKGLAIEELKRGIKNLPDHDPLRLLLIDYYKNNNEMEYALDAVNDGLAQQGSDRRFLYEKVNILTAMKKYDTAEEVLMAIVATWPEEYPGYIELARLKRMQGIHTEAVPLLEKAMDLKNGIIAALPLLLDTYMATNQYEKAEALCRQMLQDKPTDAFPLTTMGYIRLGQGNFEESEKYFKAAIDASDRYQRAHHGLVAVYAKTNRLQEASASLETILAENPDSVSTGVTLSLLYDKLGQYEKAIALLEGLAEKNPDDTAINNNLAYLYAEHVTDVKQLEKALAYAQKAWKQAPENPGILDTVAWVTFKSGDVDQAMTYAQKAVEGAADDPMIHYHAGLIHAKAGKKDNAKKYLSRALELGLEEPFAQTAASTLTDLDKI